MNTLQSFTNIITLHGFTKVFFVNMNVNLYVNVPVNIGVNLHRHGFISKTK